MHKTKPLLISFPYSDLIRTNRNAMRTKGNFTIGMVENLAPYINTQNYRLSTTRPGQYKLYKWAKRGW